MAHKNTVPRKEESHVALHASRDKMHKDKFVREKIIDNCNVGKITKTLGACRFKFEDKDGREYGGIIKNSSRKCGRINVGNYIWFEPCEGSFGDELYTTIVGLVADRRKISEYERNQHGDLDACGFDMVEVDQDTGDIDGI